MPAATSDEQLHFLLKCVKYSNSGKVDFDEVARECNIVSKGAAAKRYERLVKANGINPNGNPTPGTGTSSLQEAGNNGPTPKKPSPKTPTKVKCTFGIKTLSTRKRKPTDRTNSTSKRTKNEMIIVDSEDSSWGAGSMVNVKSEDSDDNTLDADRRTPMKFRNDPFLSQGSGVGEGSIHREDGELYSEFCAINSTTKKCVSGEPGENGLDAHGGSECDIAENGVFGMLGCSDEA
ncbi:conserved hypothetical protein [Histoplasma capsulatum G186AR]|uniref:Myb-like DNA-binding domain-containing protein n=2 Tax=Ajellomyces capsulatus TaxID=5037 RepID=C0P053_AJECG|nr:uncharacterized protein HCBG_08772 [Histoplasma capsulatum G186AR]EEH02869.1 conserved hypothetical protein [Histoplasma capsulatum G186AR]KAG5295942.1 hypothetical protein I7I52_06392 [Histoplasma capsulatum]QSS73925.1 hypothetical protein I7I50_08876 [Histoplasma capsulatum G186AR]